MEQKLDSRFKKIDFRRFEERMAAAEKRAVKSTQRERPLATRRIVNPEGGNQGDYYPPQQGSPEFSFSEYYVDRMRVISL